MLLTERQRNLAVSIAVLVFFAGILVWISRFEEARGQEFPTLVTATAILLCVIDIVARTETALGHRLTLILSGSPQPAGHARHGARTEAIAILWIAGATALMVAAGFLIGIPIYVFGYMVLHARRSVREGAVAAVATSVAIWLGFELLLSYQLYRGALFMG